MLDAPGVARLSQDDELQPPALLTTCDGALQQLTVAAASRIEEEYRHKLKMSDAEQLYTNGGDPHDALLQTVAITKALVNKKKRKKDAADAVQVNGSDTAAGLENKKKKIKVDNGEVTEEPKKKKARSKNDKIKADSSKIKTDPNKLQNDLGKLKCDNLNVKSDTELELKKVKPLADKKSDSDKESLDNVKDLFKDIKDGRIKPGAIIKSKDIAKKEGVVKKEPKPPPEAKPKTKPNNPFGKINKQENSKLTTLIAKAKESRVGLVPNSEVGDSPKLSLGSIIMSGDIGTGIKSTHETDEDEKWEPREREKWESSPWEGSNWDRPSEREENTPVREEDLVKSEREEIEEVILCQEKPLPERGEPTSALISSSAASLSQMSSTTTVCAARSAREIERITIVEEIPAAPIPRAPEIKQEKATPNLSAWFKAFGAPKASSNNNNTCKKLDGDECDDDDDDVDITEVNQGDHTPYASDNYTPSISGDYTPARNSGGDYTPSIGGDYTPAASEGSGYSRPQSRQTTPILPPSHHSPATSLTDPMNSSLDLQDDEDSRHHMQIHHSSHGSNTNSQHQGSSVHSQHDSSSSHHMTDRLNDQNTTGSNGEVVDVVDVVADESNDSLRSPERFNQPLCPSTPKPVASPEPPMSPEPPISPEKPPETPWYEKLEEKMEDEPIWRKNKVICL